MLKVLVASDSYKGSLSSYQVIQAIQEAATRLGEIEVLGIPIADGGEGTLVSIVHSMKGKQIPCQVTDPLGRKIPSYFGITPEGTAIIEMAITSGLTLLNPDERDPLVTTSYGLGEVIACALDQPNVKEIIVGIGGSATNDGGIGMAQALGLRALNKDQKEIPFGGGSLHEIETLDLENMHPRLKEVPIRVMCDVSNPLCGEQGASVVYGPQKGATTSSIQLLDRNLRYVAEKIHQELGIDMLQISGGGAAGGTGAALATFCGATLESGIEVILDLFLFENLIVDADLIVTGEGKTDDQTAFGKVVAGVAKRVQPYHKPVVCLSGALDGDLNRMYQLGVNCCFSICPGPITESHAMTHAYEYLVDTAENIFRLFMVRKRK